MTTPSRQTAILRAAECAEYVGNISVPTLYRWVRVGRFPPPRKIGPNTSGWLRSEVDAWLLGRPVESCLSPERIETTTAARLDAMKRRKAEADAAA